MEAFREVRTEHSLDRSKYGAFIATMGMLLDSYLILILVLSSVMRLEHPGFSVSMLHLTVRFVLVLS